jgi:hypothetical protein
MVCSMHSISSVSARYLFCGELSLASESSNIPSSCLLESEGNISGIKLESGCGE